MLDTALTSLTGASNPSAAWRRILHSDDVVGLKFNRSGQQSIGTTPSVARTLVASLAEAGWAPSRIVCIEAPPGTDSELRTMPADGGFDNTLIDFGSGTDQFARVLGQVTALISVPYLKTHNITGLTCSLKNLSHGLIKHPARHHRNGCDPYIADIVAAPIIREKLRLFLVDALRVVYEGGPAATNATLSDEGVLLASFDPVAVDLVGLTLLNEVRAKRGLDPVIDSADGLPYLATAHQRGLGVAVWHGIDLWRVQL